MLKNNYKALFFILLLPFYLNVMLILFGLTSGLAIEWRYMVIYIILNFSGAWLLSYGKNFLVNIFGFLCFLYYGWPLFSYIFKRPKIGPWTINVGAGIIIIALGLLGLVYIIIKRIKSQMK